MTSVDEFHARFDAFREIFEVLQEGQPTKKHITMIVETVGRVLYTLCCDVEKGKGNLIGIIIDDPEYVEKFGHSLRRPTCPRVYETKLKGEKVTVEIRKVEVVHKAKIKDWDLYNMAKEESCRFVIDSIRSKGMRGLLSSRRR